MDEELNMLHVSKRTAEDRLAAAHSAIEALQAKVLELKSDKALLEERIRSQIRKFAEWNGMFDGLSKVKRNLTPLQV